MGFAAGERVYHPSMGERTVQRQEKGDVHVIFDRQSRGEHLVGIYDENWFRTHVGWLKKLPRTQEK